MHLGAQSLDHTIGSKTVKKGDYSESQWGKQTNSGPAQCCGVKIAFIIARKEIM